MNVIDNQGLAVSGRQGIQYDSLLCRHHPLWHNSLLRRNGVASASTFCTQTKINLILF